MGTETHRIARFSLAALTVAAAVIWCISVVFHDRAGWIKTRYLPPFWEVAYLICPLVFLTLPALHVFNSRLAQSSRNLENLFWVLTSVTLAAAFLVVLGAPAAMAVFHSIFGR